MGQHRQGAEGRVGGRGQMEELLPFWLIATAQLESRRGVCACEAVGIKYYTRGNSATGGTTYSHHDTSLGCRTALSGARAVCGVVCGRP